jgi:hypothetical protein
MAAVLLLGDHEPWIFDRDLKPDAYQFPIVCMEAMKSC